MEEEVKSVSSYVLLVMTSAKGGGEVSLFSFFICLSASAFLVLKVYLGQWWQLKRNIHFISKGSLAF